MIFPMGSSDHTTRPLPCKYEGNDFSFNNLPFFCNFPRRYIKQKGTIGNMKILVLTSRYTATRDIIGEDFGRQTRLFAALKKLGHDIDFFVADYRKHENKNVKLHGIEVM